MRYISQLPEPYKSLAEKRREEDNDFKSDSLSGAFHWDVTDEGWYFWNDVDHAESIEELPPIPEAE